MRMRYENTVSFIILTVALMILPSCGSALPKLTQSSNVESRKVTYIGSTSILTKISKLDMSQTAKGKLCVKANITNKTFAPRRNIWVEVMAIFKDSEGFAFYSTKWKPLMVSKDSDLTYSVVSPDSRAKDFSISIRKR